jgi:hypothetical protein
MVAEHAQPAQAAITFIVIKVFFLFMSLQHRLIMHKGINNASDHLKELIFCL